MFKPGTKSVKTLVQEIRAVQKTATRAARGLEDAARGGVTIRWNSRTGTVRSMRGILTEPGDGSPQEIARQFLREQQELFRVHEEQTELQLAKSQLRKRLHLRLRPAVAAVLNRTE